MTADHRWCRIGLDPGATGGIGYIANCGVNGAVHPAAEKLSPMTDQDLYAFLVWLREVWPDDIFAILEKVHSSPQMGVKSAFSFGGSYRALRMAVRAAGIPFEEARPQEWKKEFGLIVPKKKGLTGPQKKALDRAKAQDLFPGERRWTNDLADAILIAEYCRRLKPPTR